MIKVKVSDPIFQKAYCNAWRALPVEVLETPKQYGKRWREAYRCRVDPSDKIWPDTSYIFDRDEDYTWFILKWA